MTDREKVIKGLKCCGTAEEGLTCFDCPYEDINTQQGMGACTSTMAMDALELMKEHEPVEPKIENAVAEVGDDEYIELSLALCGNCGIPIEQPNENNGWNYCPKCGRAVKWNESD